MKISIITLFPKMIKGFFEESIIKRAVEKKLVEIEIVNLRDFAIDDYGTVDDRPYGGGTGMILRIEPIYKAIEKVKSQKSKVKISSKNLKVVITSPKGKTFNQKKAVEYSKLDHLIIIAGHYEDVDARVLDFVDEEVSMGDFIMTGGEITAVAIVDSLVRLIPGVLKKDEAVRQESFNINNKKLLEYPQYTRPESFKGLKVPKVLMSGDHKKIEDWRLKKALEETRKKRPDLLLDK
ncbi:tRNA (guanosine(37)-N1)-methyltransferase TrmD [Candidatus Roizmanbacteria bacterium CG22_combo_CG10-13_8_21_14_all_35_9]|uniref:tRNA (guanine-N(1)-)-methyltransferase n=4 Tax=Candidatus Roizmaniibacteriota TaxID=1752723 RepID=A0A2M8F3D6_9BACT|nr:MAG: tRNA (guanosine(37)-N1)-methyltransferase TrmD [Candidatus Roizmanbacteria bacterium CG22_combo_CG10-13_8_21_14_all_35_9]PJC33797.1 MAG: tRNA (guanosine(37)-N1)-methyltransferase TrmD [Candidatus Roizmanbacteria bacterium CG_4_9_14_0_2_um_filter_35_15]